MGRDDKGVGGGGGGLGERGTLAPLFFWHSFAVLWYSPRYIFTFDQVKG